MASSAIHSGEVPQYKAVLNADCVDCATVTTEHVLAETNSNNHKTTKTATTVTVERAMTSDRVMDHLFTFLSFCAPQPIPKNVVVDYVKTMEVYDDEETIGAKIKRCPLMLFDEEESGVYLRVQEVVHCCVSAVTNSFSKETRQNRIRRCYRPCASLRI